MPHLHQRRTQGCLRFFSGALLSVHMGYSQIPFELPTNFYEASRGHAERALVAGDRPPEFSVVVTCRHDLTTYFFRNQLGDPTATGFAVSHPDWRIFTAEPCENYAGEQSIAHWPSVLLPLNAMAIRDPRTAGGAVCGVPSPAPSLLLDYPYPEWFGILFRERGHFREHTPQPLLLA